MYVMRHPLDGAQCDDVSLAVFVSNKGAFTIKSLTQQVISFLNIKFFSEEIYQIIIIISEIQPK